MHQGDDTTVDTPGGKEDMLATLRRSPGSSRLIPTPRAPESASTILFQLSMGLYSAVTRTCRTSTMSRQV
jgi:hypothetical protein